LLDRSVNKDTERQRKTVREKIFPVKDFSNFGSKSLTVRPAQEQSEMLHKYLNKLLERPHGFDLKTVKRSDRCSIAIVETNTLSTGKKLFLFGGENFQDLTRNQFEKVAS